MQLTLLRIAGAVNALFVFFHLWLGWQFHHATHFNPGTRALLEIFNGGGALFILFLAAVGLLLPHEALSTRIGRLTLWLAATLYGLRGLAEFVVTPRTTLPIVVTCLLTAGLYLGIMSLSHRGGSTAQS